MRFWDAVFASSIVSAGAGATLGFVTFFVYGILPVPENIEALWLALVVWGIGAGLISVFKSDLLKDMAEEAQK